MFTYRDDNRDPCHSVFACWEYLLKCKTLKFKASQFSILATVMWILLRTENIVGPMQLLQHLNTAVKYQKSKKEGPTSELSEEHKERSGGKRYPDPFSPGINIYFTGHTFCDLFTTLSEW